MRVCHICSNYDDFFINFMEKQRINEIDLKVFYFRAKERGWPNVNSSYVDVRLNYRNWHRFFFRLKETLVLKDFFSMYNKDDFDLFHAHTLFSNGYIALEVKRKWGIPYIVAVRDVDVNIFFKYRLTLRKLGIEILKEAEKIIFLSPFYRDLVLKKYVPKHLIKDFQSKSLVIPNGIDEFYLKNKWLRGDLFDKNEINIITVGYISRRKNQLTVCKSIERLIKLGMKVNYIVVGKILDKKVFKKLKKYSFVNYVPFLPKEELINEFRKADIYVMPSITETFGLTYAEAMSQGLPLIYTKNQGFDGQFEEGTVGYSVNSSNYIEIANKICEIIKNYQFLSTNAVKKVDKFDWGKITQYYKSLYLEVLRN